MNELGDGFKWFFGVVENRDDPMKIGRLKIRIHNYHSTNTVKVSVSDLPWAIVVNPVFGASTRQVGITSLGCVVGATVFGFFADGDKAQIPVVIGTVAGAPGMNDASNDLPDLSRGSNSLNKQPLGPEPPSPYKARYPYNKVFRSESGHVIEIDDTPNHERLHQYHRSGTYVEIDKDGTRVQKIVGDDYVIVAKDQHVHIEGKVNLTIKGNVNYHVKGDMNVTVDGTYNVTAGAKRETITGQTDIRYEGPLHDYYGDHHYARRQTGRINFSCPADIRSGSTDCSEVASAVKLGD